MMRALLLSAVFICGAASSAAAERRYVLDVVVGPAFLTKSRSRAIGHGFKPAARIGLRVGLLPRLEVGGTVSGIVDESEHYRVVGGLAHGRFALWQRPAFSVGTSLAVGAGYDADILHSSLEARGRILPYGFAALDARWFVRPGWLVGVEAGWENLSTVRLGALLGFAWDAPIPQATAYAGATGT